MIDLPAKVDVYKNVKTKSATLEHNVLDITFVSPGMPLVALRDNTKTLTAIINKYI